MSDQISHTHKTLEQEALDFIYLLEELYFEQRDMEQLLSVMGPGITWIGTGPDDFCHNLEEAKEALAREKEEYPGRFLVKQADHHVQVLSDTVCVIYGLLVAVPELTEQVDLADLQHRFSILCIKTPQGMQVAHLHLSQPDRAQKDGQCFVRQHTVTEREELQARVAQTVEQLRARDQELENMTDNIPGGIHQCKCDETLTLLRVSNGFLSLIAYTKEELAFQFQNHFIELIYAGDREKVKQSLQRQLQQEDGMIELEYRIQRKDGRSVWILDKGKVATLPDGSRVLYCMLLDITNQRREQEQLRLSLERHKIIMDQATDIIFEWDMHKDSLIFSTNWRKKFGYKPITTDVSRRLPFSTNIYPEDMPTFLKLMTETAKGEPYTEVELRICDDMRQYIWCRIRATVQYDGNGKPVKAVGVILDIDAEKRLRQDLLRKAQRDGLTGLYNKVAARQEIEIALAGYPSGALLILDLDDFKEINDRYGHLTGDAVLSDTAGALKHLFRATDIVARIGGDEFLVYLSGAPAREIERKANLAIQALAEIPVFGQKGRVSCSIGAALFPQDACVFSELYRCADLALYQVKNSGKGGFRFYESNMCMQEPDGDVVRSSVSTMIDSEMGIVNEKLGQYCFQMLYHAIDPLVAVNQILEIVGQVYDVSRVYIFESSEDGQCCSNTFEWCSKGVPHEMENLQNLSYQQDLADYTKNFDKNGVFYCGDIHELHPVLTGLMAAQGICSVLQCAIKDDGQFKGYVGFDECRENRRWTKAQIETLTLVANVLSTFLLKIRFKEQLSKLKRGNSTTW